MNGFIFFGLIGLFVSCIITFENGNINKPIVM